MCSEYYMRTELGQNLTRMDRRTAISEYSNFPNTFLENLHPSLVLKFIYCTDNSTNDEANKRYNNILYTSYTEKFLTKKIAGIRDYILYLVFHALC